MSSKNVYLPIFFFQAEDGIRDLTVTGVQTCALPIFVFNDIARDDIGFDAAENEVVLVSADGERRLGKAAKERIAAAILDAVAERLGAGVGARRRSAPRRRPGGRPSAATPRNSGAACH